MSVPYNGNQCQHAIPCKRFIYRPHTLQRFIYRHHTLTRFIYRPCLKYTGELRSDILLPQASSSSCVTTWVAYFTLNRLNTHREVALLELVVAPLLQLAVYATRQVLVTVSRRVRRKVRGLGHRLAKEKTRLEAFQYHNSQHCSKLWIN